jgi:hypothetical protein
MNINLERLANFINCRRYNGIISREELLQRIQRLSVRSVLPPGWEWR